MLSKVFVVLAFLVLISIQPMTAFAQEASPIPSPTPNLEINSFEVFWPMVAGKTMQSRVYFIKTLKENIRGFFIFGAAQKAEYNTFLSTKRMLEAEVLIQAEDGVSASKTIEKASSLIESAKSGINTAKNSGEIEKQVVDQINIRVSNLKDYANWLKQKYPDYDQKLQDYLNQLNSISI